MQSILWTQWLSRCRWRGEMHPPVSTGTEGRGHGPGRRHSLLWLAADLLDLVHVLGVLRGVLSRPLPWLLDEVCAQSEDICAYQIKASCTKRLKIAMIIMKVYLEDTLLLFIPYTWWIKLLQIAISWQWLWRLTLKLALFLTITSDYSTLVITTSTTITNPNKIFDNNVH